MELLIDSFRDKDKILGILKNIKFEAKKLKHKLNIMEVCGGHTHSIMKYGLNKLLDDNINFIHGPGCPVCIMPKNRIDHAYEIALQDDVILLTLGDMIKIPGSRGNLQKARSEGCDVRFIYSPMEALKIAQENKNKRVVFFAIGFETTTPMSAALLNKAINQDIKNLFFHINHVLVPPPLEIILDSKDCNINALIAPSHVSVITGAKIYKPLLKYNIPIVVGGFEPLDIMDSVLRIVKQASNNEAKLDIEYSRVVSMEGNTLAQELVNKYFIKRDFEWRGLGNIKDSALKLKDEYARFDAEIVFNDILSYTPIMDNKVCICGKILRGVAKPTDCKVFGKVCNPQNPLGSCMVSSEGSCAAYYKYKNVNIG
ncbi:hydrogenase formation protein HypD [Helicobacter sp. MIT 99-5507]|uniref:hydrogenase formation protein HypD n=1 Tax=Helicobacter sp. MIT 99-5507 TaxID=152489 RepID=UPI000E1F0BAE|nr:hydrogenase formation protein HypD [Helicobacter sp. MIT 99-5507]RDU58410.1 hydrogenase formation protein HypD [Helicobacter sp. MIT 99-5507]